MVLMGIVCPGCLSERTLTKSIASPLGHSLSHAVWEMPVTLASSPQQSYRSKYLTGNCEAELVFTSARQQYGPGKAMSTVG